MTDPDGNGTLLTQDPPKDDPPKDDPPKDDPPKDDPPKDDPPKDDPPKDDPPKDDPPKDDPPKDDSKDKEGAPDSYENFKLPEQTPVTEEQVEKLGVLAKDLDLTQEQAQKVVDMAAEHLYSLA